MENPERLLCVIYKPRSWVRYKKCGEEFLLEIMASPKNWNRRWKKEHETAWMHETQPMEVVLEEAGPKAGPGENWEANIFFQDDEFEYHHEEQVNEHIGVFMNRDEGRKAAVRWMRNHPML